MRARDAGGYSRAIMLRTPSLVLSAALAASALASHAAPAWAAPAAPVPPGQIAVIAPTRSAFLGAALGMGKTVLTGGCVLRTAEIQRSAVRATYACEAGVAALEVRHPGGVTGALATTEQFAIVGAGPVAPPQTLVDAVAERLRAKESEWQWTFATDASDAQRHGEGAAAEHDTPGGAPSGRREGMTKADQLAYDRAVETYKGGDPKGAYEALYALARGMGDRGPGSGVLGMLVAALASRGPDEALVQSLASAAEAAPSDPLPQFVAGVAAHYHAHQSGRTKEDKARFYETTLKLLARTHPAYDLEPRVWIYTAVSYYRTGHQAEAEQAIEKAVALGRRDADAFYCRAEVYHRKDPKKAIADMTTYKEIMEENKKLGTIVSRSKEERVARMLAYMSSVAEGRASADATELFDPPKRTIDLSELPPMAPVVGGAAAVGLAVVGLVALRRRRRAKANRAS